MTSKETFIRQKDICDPLRAIVHESWFEKCLIYAIASMAESTGSTIDEIRGANKFKGILLNLPDLRNAGFVIKYDRTMKMIEDRTPELMLKPMRREDKGVSPNDKSHAMLAKLRNLNSAAHPINMREIRKSVLASNQWPAAWGPVTDWYDGQSISEF